MIKAAPKQLSDVNAVIKQAINRVGFVKNELRKNLFVIIKPCLHLYYYVSFDRDLIQNLSRAFVVC